MTNTIRELFKYCMIIVCASVIIAIGCDYIEGFVKGVKDE